MATMTQNQRLFYNSNWHVLLFVTIIEFSRDVTSKSWNIGTNRTNSTQNNLKCMGVNVTVHIKSCRSDNVNKLMNPHAFKIFLSRLVSVSTDVEHVIVFISKLNHFLIILLIFHKCCFEAVPHLNLYVWSTKIDAPLHSV